MAFYARSLSHRVRKSFVGSDATRVYDRARDAAARYGVRFAFYSDAQKISIIRPTLASDLNPMSVGIACDLYGVDHTRN